MRTDILQQAQAIRASMDAAAIVLTDEQAAKAPRLYPTWAAGLTVYKAGTASGVQSACVVWSLTTL